MDWTQALTIILSNFGIMLVLFVYLMSRMDSNQKQMNEKFQGMNQSFNSLENKVNTLEVETKSELRGLNQRLTDFQGQVNQRLSTIEGYLVPRKVFRFEETEHKDEPKEN